MREATNDLYEVRSEPEERIRLEFRAAEELERIDDALERDISALAVHARSLFYACDETATVERLLWDSRRGAFGSHRSFALGEHFDLPDGPDGEMDIEGLAIDGGYLWITGSHSYKRDDPDEGDTDLSSLDDIDVDPNRGFLGRVPLVDRGDGELEPVGRIETLDGVERTAACMKMRDDGRTLLRKRLSGDRLLAPFMGLPCKENGFDVEGLAASGDRLWLGLRGPVIGQRSLLVEVRTKTTKKGWLKPRRLSDGRRYRLVALPLDGLGVRDLLIDGDRMLVLAGATTDVEGPQSIYSVELSRLDEAAVVAEADVVRILDLPVHRGCDHAEGIAFFEREGRRCLAVAYDAPADDRIDEKDHWLELDLFDVLTRVGGSS
ncbi:MAG: DUF3616 domain-containing protein [Acidobacteria bacterium]|nr:MAG: DUF3616 domain-containing protein [Acidobacteriota bacterium]REK03839.1 MAG: DUF3616 domain-containing protein [Acidobacteriota bacterium]